jgi:hypothetical protein
VDFNRIADIEGLKVRLELFGFDFVYQIHVINLFNSLSCYNGAA